MRIRSGCFGAALSFLCCAQAFSGTVAGVGVRDSATVGTIERWSVGVNAELMKRELHVSGDNSNPTAEARSVSLFAGYDVLKWLTVFGTVGGSDFKPAYADTYGDSNAKFSLGLQGNLWQMAVTDPDFLAGSLMLKSIVEISSHRIGGNGYDGDWQEYAVTIPVCYEIFAGDRDNTKETPYSLAFSVGPALSILNGSTSGSLGRNTDFRQKSPFGGFAAVDLYISHNLSVGCQLTYFDDATVGGNLIYNF